MAETKTKTKRGRPTIMTEQVIGKLEQAFAYDCTIGEACFYAGINPDTYHEYVKRTPEFAERVKALRNTPVMAARQKVIDDIKTDTDTAKWYLERKFKNEFSTKVENDVRVKEAPKPIMELPNVQQNDSNQKNIEAEQKD